MEHPKKSAEDLVAAALGMKRLDLFLHFEMLLEEGQLLRSREFLLRRSRGEPLEYILGSVEFLDCKIFVDSHVLIPRVETEILASLVRERLKGCRREGKTLLDLCCGSGCIGLSLKKKFFDLHIALSDISKEALDVARKSAQALAIDVEFLQGDLLQPFAGRRCDFLVCNPPYVSFLEYRDLAPGVKDYEPRQALVGGADGLDYYRRLERELPCCLNPGALVWFEIGHSQADAVFSLFSSPHWKSRQVKRDWSGKERFFFLEFE